MATRPLSDDARSATEIYKGLLFTMHLQPPNALGVCLRDSLTRN
ncbi:hypothetical protein QFZ97_004547 [Paraburkholderia youngii]